MRSSFVHMAYGIWHYIPHSTFHSRDSGDFRFCRFFRGWLSSSSQVRCQSLSLWGSQPESFVLGLLAARACVALPRVLRSAIGYRLMCLLIHVDVLIYLRSAISVFDFDMQWGLRLGLGKGIGVGNGSCVLCDNLARFFAW